MLKNELIFISSLHDFKENTIYGMALQRVLRGAFQATVKLGHFANFYAF